jgi:phosphoserine aminotransferase
MNLMGRRPDAPVDFIHTGSWSGKSIKKRKKYATVNVAASAASNGFTAVPARESWQLSGDDVSAPMKR